MSIRETMYKQAWIVRYRFDASAMALGAYRVLVVQGADLFSKNLIMVTSSAVVKILGKSVHCYYF